MKTKYFTAYRFLADKHLFNTHHLSYVIFSGLKFWDFDSLVDVHKQARIYIRPAVYAFNTFSAHICNITFRMLYKIL